MSRNALTYTTLSSPPECVIGEMSDACREHGVVIRYDFSNSGSTEGKIQIYTPIRPRYTNKVLQAATSVGCRRIETRMETCTQALVTLPANVLSNLSTVPEWVFQCVESAVIASRTISRNALRTADNEARGARTMDVLESWIVETQFQLLDLRSDLLHGNTIHEEKWYRDDPEFSADDPHFAHSFSSLTPKFRRRLRRAEKETFSWHSFRQFRERPDDDADGIEQLLSDMADVIDYAPCDDLKKDGEEAIEAIHSLIDTLDPTAELLVETRRWLRFPQDPILTDCLKTSLHRQLSQGVEL